MKSGGNVNHHDKVVQVLDLGFRLDPGLKYLQVRVTIKGGDNLEIFWNFESGRFGKYSECRTDLEII